MSIFDTLTADIEAKKKPPSIFDDLATGRPGVGSAPVAVAKSLGRAGVGIAASMVEAPAAYATLALEGGPGFVAQMANLPTGTALAIESMAPSALSMAPAGGALRKDRGSLSTLRATTDEQLRQRLGGSTREPMDYRRRLKHIKQIERAITEPGRELAAKIRSPFEKTAALIRRGQQSTLLRRVYDIDPETPLGDKLKDWRWWVEDFTEGAGSAVVFLIPGQGAMAAARRSGATRKQAARIGGAVAGGLVAVSETGASFHEIKADLMAKGMSEADASIVAARGGVAYGIVSGLIERGIFPRQFAGAGSTTTGLRGWLMRVFASGTGEMAEEEAQMLMMGLTRYAVGLDPNLSIAGAAETAIMAAGGGIGVRSLSRADVSGKPPTKVAATEQPPTEAEPAAEAEAEVEEAVPPAQAAPVETKKTYSDVNAQVETYLPGFVTKKGPPQFGRGGRGRVEHAIQALNDSGEQHQMYLATLLQMRLDRSLTQQTSGGLVGIEPGTLKVGDRFQIGDRQGEVTAVTDFSVTVEMTYEKAGAAQGDSFVLPIDKTVFANKGSLVESQIGRPELANPATSEAARALVDKADQQRKEAGIPERRADSEVAAQAQAKVADDPGAVRTNLLDVAQRGDQLGDVDTLAAAAIVDEASQEAVADDTKVGEAVELINAYRNTGTEQARAFRQRRDPVKSPAQRTRQAANDRIMEPSNADAKALRRLHDQEVKARRKLRKARTDHTKQKARDALARVLQRKARVLDHYAETVRKTLDALRRLGLSPSQITDEQLTDPKVRHRLIRTVDTIRSAPFDAAREFYINSILSGPQTQAANIIGNAANGIWETTAQRIVEVVTNLFVRAPEGAQIGELRAMMRGLLPGLARASRNFLMAYSTESPMLEEEVNQARAGAGEELISGLGTKIELTERKKAIKGTKGRVIRVPTRLLIAFDELFKGFFGTIEVHARAYRIAKSEKLKGQDVADRVDDLVNDLASPAWEQAVEEAERLAFQQQLGSVGQLAIEARRRFPALVFFLPFITTPVNIFKAGLAKTPLVSVATAYRITKQGMVNMNVLPDGGVEYTRQKFNRDLANNVTAWAVFLALASLMGGDDEDDLPRITGTTKWEPGRSGLAYRTAPPQSIRIGDRWYSYARIEPLATSLAAMIDVLNEIKNVRAGKDISTAINDTIGSLKRQISDKTFLRGMGELIRVVSEDDEKTALRLAQTFVTAWVPNIVKQVGRGADPFIRETKLRGTGADFWHRLNSRTLYRALPFAQAAPPPKVDLWGREIERGHSFGSAGSDFMYRTLVPIRIQSADKVNRIDRLILNWNNANPNELFAPRPPQPFFTFRGERYDMSDDEYHTFMMFSGKYAADHLEKATMNVNDPTEADIDRIKSWLSRGRKIGRNRARTGIHRRRRAEP